jgi:hypothetical protein
MDTELSIGNVKYFLGNIFVLLYSGYEFDIYLRTTSQW